VGARHARESDGIDNAGLDELLQADIGGACIAGMARSHI
jgi:hypothetical protein